MNQIFRLRSKNIGVSTTSISGEPATGSGGGDAEG
jgi:hypothetical protein